MSDDISADLQLALDAARRAGAVVLRYFGTDMQVRHKGADQPLTDADVEADDMLREQLTGARPDYGWLSEETADSPDRLARSRVWIVDPIDGTRSFVAGRAEFSLSLGLVEDGSVSVGVVYNPVTDELYYATRGGGAFLVEKGAQAVALRLNGRTAGNRLLASRGEIGSGLLEPFTGAFVIEPVGSTAYKMARVAAGRGDVFVSRMDKNEWDVCAGALVVAEAGGRVTDTAGAALSFNREDPSVRGVLAGAAGVHEQVLKLVAALPPREEA